MTNQHNINVTLEDAVLIKKAFRIAFPKLDENEVIQAQITLDTLKRLVLQDQSERHQLWREFGDDYVNY